MKRFAHVFFTLTGFRTSRWKRVFPRATITDRSLSTTALSAGPMIAWVFSGRDEWTETVATLTETGAKVIVMSCEPALNELKRALRSGALGYIHAVASPDRFQQAATAVKAGDLWLPAEVVNNVIRTLVNQAPGTVTCDSRDTAAIEGLTHRERGVADAVAMGLSNKELADQFEITERTVKSHLSAIFRKLDLRDRMQLAARIRSLRFTKTNRDE